MTVLEKIATAVGALKNREAIADNPGLSADVRRNATFWADRHRETLEGLAKDWLPSGSGFDSGTTVDIEASRADRIVLKTEFHHLSEHGYYTKWTSHKVILKPTFTGPYISVTGPDYNGIKEYIGDTFYAALQFNP